MRRLALTLALFASPAVALDLTIPNATVTRTETDPAGTVRLPDAPYSPDSVIPVAEGAITTTVLRVPGSSPTTLQLLSGLRDTLEDAGYQRVFGCADQECGSFDFRFQLDVVGEPEMHVDLGDYRYLLMQAPNPATEPHTVALLASRSQTAGFVQITTIETADLAPLAPEPLETDDSAIRSNASDPAPEGLITQLVEAGHAVLPDLDFGTGSADLGLGSYASLQAVADWLRQNPSARIILVGHTDSIGSLEANTALSRRRAASVADFLVAELGSDAAQITSSGAGYLAPVASNLSENGRAANRRVEVVLLSLD